MDAFAHCLEAFSSPHYHPMSQGIALEGMRLVKENLTAVYNNPGDITGRAHMMSAAMMGATAFQKGLGAIPCPVTSDRGDLSYPSWHLPMRL
jgi:alcohol dehydrogenase class IV